jgi:hypothetical protein
VTGLPLVAWEKPLGRPSIATAVSLLDKSQLEEHSLIDFLASVRQVPLSSERNR